MIAAADIGNTNTKICLINKDSSILYYKVFLNNNSGYKSNLINYLQKFIKFKTDKAVISSVVPNKGNLVSNLFVKELNIQPIFINQQIKLPVKFKIKNRKALGSDRICNCIAAWELSKRLNNVIAMDFGTAFTFNVVLKEGIMDGGLIIPGIDLMLKSLHFGTKKLPLIKAKNININQNLLLGDDTDSAIKYGVINALTGATEHLIKETKKYYNRNFKIYITGGGGKKMSELISSSCIYEEYLILKGIYYISKYNGFI